MAAASGTAAPENAASESGKTDGKSDTGNSETKSRTARRKRRRNRRGAPGTRGAAGGREKLYAALDLGTNNCRLLIARRTSDGFKVVDAFSRIVRLGEGVAANGCLSDQAMDRAVEALRICAEKMERRGVGRARAIATAACRAADNGPDFIKRVKREAGLSLEIVSTEDEARLALAGCAPLLDRDCEAALVFDIGGGSTELIWVEIERPGDDGAEPARPRIADWISLPHGVVTLAEKYGGEDVSEDIYREMVEEVAGHLEPFAARMADWHEEARNGAMPPFHLLGTSGTVTTIAGVMLDLKRYDRTVVDGIWLSPGDVHRVTRDLIAMDYDSRAGHPCVGEERADLVLAGCAIFEAIAEAWPSQRLRVADRGLREGILLSMMDADASKARRRRRRRRRKQKANRQQGPAANATEASSE
ncbi:Ppx/GppA phosphatase family protein [Parvibaculum sp.]|uniref:Ppx/GppA phosphatase family protein n=1 Tax=Parvibaculum sp. TaxID=2024848 RepID=UPI000C8D720C|nr:Ppx/GppA phosphatase family protein [Parvibaculum sp.]MAB12522.1 Ppx/GppA phosphatase [Parvibaculum sp.]